MSKDNKIKIYNRLFFKLYLNYAIMLLVTAVLICLIFMKLYKDTTEENLENQLEAQAESVSERMFEFISSRKYNEALRYIFESEEITGLDIWTISNPQADVPMDESMETTSYDEIANTEELVEYKSIIKSTFRNISVTREGYDRVYEVPTITVARPVYNANREVVGAVLLKKMVNEQKEVISSSMTLIVISCVVALAISFIIIIVFATELSLPITRMRVTALKLAAGDYKSKTGIKRNDELGDLANTVDILSDKLYENQIQRINMEKMRLDFFANVSHELRTPITVVRAYTETLFDKVVTDEDKRMQYYERMLSECKTMERLVRDLLLLSKMQNPDFIITKEPVNLVQVLDDIIRSASTIAAKKNITINVNKENPTYLIFGDYDRLRQMFMVILDNAIKFSENNKTVHISLLKRDNIIVSIKDEGIGIDEGDIEYIFDKFYKTSLRQNAGGSGLGLAIAKQIALKHDGDILVKSIKGVGTEFMFTFPICDME